MATVARTREELSRCIIEMLVKEPFFGHLLAGVVRTVSDATPTAAVALTRSGVQLRVNPDFFMKELRRRPMRVAVVKHECLHLLFKHLMRLDDRKHPRLFNIAADLVVNQFVRPWKLPDSAVTLATFPDLDLLPDQTVEWYYERLSDLHDGRCEAPESKEALDGLMGSTWHSDHDGWAQMDPSAMSQGLRDALESELDRMIIQARDRSGPRAWGRLPGPLKALINAIIEARRPKVDWRRAMRLFAASSRRTRIVGTQRRESRRYAQQAFLRDTDHRHVPGIKVRQFSRLAVAVDTSGSVSDRDLSLFFSEVHGLWRAGAEVEVIECDAAVQRCYPYRGVLPDAVAGRGGTNFDPVFAYLRSNRHVRYDGCIYLTDGGAPEPTVTPPCKLLWVVTADGWIGDHLSPGRVIQIPND